MAAIPASAVAGVESAGPAEEESMLRPMAGASRHLLLLVGLAALASACSTFQTPGSSELTDELQRAGMPAEAAVVAMEDTGESIDGYYIVRLAVEVRPADRQPYQATIQRLVISGIQAFQYQPGKIIAVHYDPRDPSRVAVDPAPVAAASGR
jgi:hypothetical protein